MKFGQFMSKGKTLSKNSTETETWKVAPGPFSVCKELSTTSIGKWFFLKEATYIRYVLAKLSILPRSADRTLLIPFYKGLFEN